MATKSSHTAPKKDGGGVIARNVGHFLDIDPQPGTGLGTLAAEQLGQGAALFLALGPGDQPGDALRHGIGDRLRAGAGGRERASALGPRRQAVAMLNGAPLLRPKNFQFQCGTA